VRLVRAVPTEAEYEAAADAADKIKSAIYKFPQAERPVSRSRAILPFMQTARSGQQPGSRASLAGRVRISPSGPSGLIG
jgi:hypothetical protein